MNAGKLYSIASVFFGIIAVCVSMIFFISFPAAVLAITFGIFAVRRYYRKSGTTAIVLGVVGIVITIVIFLNIVQALNVHSLIAGNWNTENSEYIKFTDRGTYIWYLDKNSKKEFMSGYYKLSTGVYKSGMKYTVGYTVTLNQLQYVAGEKIQDQKSINKFLIYTPNKEVIDSKNNKYEMMNMTTGTIVKIEKEKVNWFWPF